VSARARVAKRLIRTHVHLRCTTLPLRCNFVIIQNSGVAVTWVAVGLPQSCYDTPKMPNPLRGPWS